MALNRAILRGRRRAALAGIVAILFQAILFGWHHHPLQFGTQPSSAAIVANGAAPLSPLIDDDDCEICQTLHHQCAAGPEFAFAPAPPPLTPTPPARDYAVLASAPALAFRARAPPLV